VRSHLEVTTPGYHRYLPKVRSINEIGTSHEARKNAAPGTKPWVGGWPRNVQPQRGERPAATAATTRPPEWVI